MRGFYKGRKCLCAYVTVQSVLLVHGAINKRLQNLRTFKHLWKRPSIPKICCHLHRAIHQQSH